MRKILILIIVISIIGGVSWFFYKKAQVAKNPSVTPTLKSLFFSDSTNSENSGDNFKLGDIFKGGQPSDTTNSTEKKSQFKKITSYPVAGMVAYDLTTTKTLPVPTETPKAVPVVETTTKKVVRYVSRRNGYVYEIEGNNTPIQITNISIPNIYEAVFTNKNNNVLLRFLRGDDRTIATYNVPIPKENSDGTRTQLSGSFFPDNIASIATSPDTTRVSYLIPNINGSKITLSDFANIKPSLFLDSTFKEWSVSWPTESRVFIQTKPSYLASGFLYYVDTKEKKMRKVIGNTLGLTTNISPSGKYIIYSQQSGGGVVTRILNIENNSDNSLPVAILPEKCVWLKNDNLICAGNTKLDGLLPDTWYQGTSSFSDKIYLIDTRDGSTKFLYDGSDKSFDITQLQIDETGRLLYFIDKTTGELWRFNY